MRSCMDPRTGIRTDSAAWSYRRSRIDQTLGEAMTQQSVTTQESGPPFPPFNRETAAQKVRMAEDAWNSQNPEKVSMAYSPDSKWRNRSEFVNGRIDIVAFLTRKWNKELE